MTCSPERAFIYEFIGKALFRSFREPPFCTEIVYFQYLQDLFVRGPYLGYPHLCKM